MSATEQMRAMLDGLMGTARDGNDSQRQHLHFTDSRVCRAFLLDCCPHDIFASTKLELGDCQKVHDPALRADYIIANKAEDFMYELSALERLQSFVNEADKKTEYLKRKLAETQEELTVEETNKLNQVHDLTEKLGKKLAQVDKADVDGDSELKKRLLEESEKIKKERSLAESEYRKVSRPASSHQQQNLRVCDICSAYLGINDNDSRLADHFGGKLHLGFITVREKLEDLRRIASTKRGAAKKSGATTSVAERTMYRSRAIDKERDRDRNSDYDYERSVRDKERSFERARSRDYDRHRLERDYDRMDRYRDRPRDSRYRASDRDRERDRERDRSRSSGRYYSTNRDSRSRDRPYRDDRNSERMDRTERRDSIVSSRSGRGAFDRGDVRGHQERDLSYQRRLREWEKREAERAKKYTIRQNEEQERKLLEEQESRKLKEFLEDYKDDRDDIRFYQGSALARRLADRRKEIEHDEVCRRKEKMELDILSRTCAAQNSSPQQIKCANEMRPTIVQQANGKHAKNPNNNEEDIILKNVPEDAKPSTAPSASVVAPAKSSSSEDKKKLVEDLISRIPTDKEKLFETKVDWAMLSESLLNNRIRQWLERKIADLLGEETEDVIEFVVGLLKSNTGVSGILAEVGVILADSDSAQKFTMHLWRLLIFETEAKKIGLRK